jgi:hypothetical protein
VDSAGGPALDLAELGARADRLVAVLQAAHARLEQIVSQDTDAPSEQWRDALLALSYFDVQAVPTSAVGDSTEAAEPRRDGAVAGGKRTRRPGARQGLSLGSTLHRR